MTVQPSPDVEDAQSPDVAERLGAEEDADLRAALFKLAQLATSQVPLTDMLTQVAAFAVRAIPGADGAGLTLLNNGQAEYVVTSAAFVREIEEIQYSIGEGPCITAADERRTVRAGSLGNDRQWPRFGPRIARLGVHSTLSLPLLTGPGDVVGALNVYARAEHAFDERAAELAELYAIPAAVSVQTARDLMQARTLAAQLQTALTSRAVIDQAMGIMISRSGCSQAEAFERLRAVSQKENRKVAIIAQQIVDDAIRRARARQADLSTAEPAQRGAVGRHSER